MDDYILWFKFHGKDKKMRMLDGFRLQIEWINKSIEQIRRDAVMDQVKREALIKDGPEKESESPRGGMDL